MKKEQFSAVFGERLFSSSLEVILGEFVEYSSSSLQLIDASGWDVSDGLTPPGGG